MARMVSCLLHCVSVSTVHYTIVVRHCSRLVLKSDYRGSGEDRCGLRPTGGYKCRLDKNRSGRRKQPPSEYPFRWVPRIDKVRAGRIPSHIRQWYVLCLHGHPMVLVVGLSTCGETRRPGLTASR
ncbi:hypothetical protein BDV12DRAFT_167369 [Aspergillus spectabilis]